MNFNEWADLLSAQNNIEENSIEIDIEPLPGETEEQTLARFLADKEIVVVNDDNTYYYDLDKAEKVSPDLRKLLEAINEAEIRSNLDYLIDNNYVYMSVDDKGEFIYALTEKGRKKGEELNASDIY